MVGRGLILARVLIAGRAAVPAGSASCGIFAVGALGHGSIVAQAWDEVTGSPQFIRQRRRQSASAFADLFDRLGQDIVEVTDHAEVCDLEDGGVFVLVDRHDGLGCLHAGFLVDGPGDSH